MKLNKKGALSTILTTVIILSFLITIFVNMIYSLVHLSVKNNLNDIAQIGVTTIAQQKKITNEMNLDHKKEIEKYTPILKECSIIYSIYEFKDTNYVKIAEINGEDISNKPIFLKSNEKIEMKIIQNKISVLQKFQNNLKHKEGFSSINALKSRVVEQ